MRLPTGRFHQFLGRYAACPLEQFQNLVRLAALAGALRFLRAFGRFLGRAGILGRLPLLLRNVGVLWRNTGLFGGFGLLGCRRGGAGGCFFCDRNHVFSLDGDYRVTTWITPVRRESKRIIRELIGGDEEAMLPQNVQMPADALR